MSIFSWNILLVCLIFLKRSLVFPILLFSSISLHWSLRKAFSSLLDILRNFAVKREYLSFSPLPLTSLLFSAICSEVKVIQLFLILCNPMGCTVHWFLQARILGWVAFPFSRGFYQTRDQTQFSHIAGGFFTSWATREVLFVRPPQKTILSFCNSFSWRWSWSLPPVQCHKSLSIVLQGLCLSDLFPWTYLSLPLYNCKGFDLGHTWMI